MIAFGESIFKQKDDRWARMFKGINLYGTLLIGVLFAVGCAHYPLNQPIEEYKPGTGYRTRFMKSPEKSEKVMVMLTFSGGGTRAAAFSYGVLEVLRDTEIVPDGKKRTLLDEVDAISAVSGGSFTAGYYGLFGERIFEDFEGKFLKKDIQGALTARTFFNPINWFRLSLQPFDRSDLAAEYYDKYLFEGGTFGDMMARKGPMVIINATDMTHGIRFGFTQGTFDTICSDLLRFPVARAVAASSAVPLLLSPVSLRNYAGTCDYKLPERFEEMLKSPTISERQFYLANNIAPFLDSKKKPYIHLVDGGVSDNLGLRALLDRVMMKGSFWKAIEGSAMEKVNKVAIIVVNAETQPDTKWDGLEGPPPLGAMLSSYASIAIERYNQETIALLKESLKSWADEVRTQRCKGRSESRESDSCGDIKFYLIEVKFDALKDENERVYFKRLPTSFSLRPEQVVRLREVARRIMIESPEFQRLLNDLR